MIDLDLLLYGDAGDGWSSELEGLVHGGVMTVVRVLPSELGLDSGLGLGSESSLQLGAIGLELELELAPARRSSLAFR